MIVPRIKINRLYVLTESNLIAYDETFHSGVNIIRGENSSGKSTIMHLLFFALGAAYKNFVSEAKKCRDVYVELCLNESIFTFCRRLLKNTSGDVNDRSEMEIHWGCLAEALARSCKKEVFGFNATETKSSFSNIIFELLGIPEVKEDSNITIHQLLRLMYIDQDSPTNSLFFYEQFDSQAKRESVADLLLGSYDSDLYSLIEKEKQEQDNLASVKSMLNGLGKLLSDPNLKSVESIKQIINEKNEDVKKIDQSIVELSSAINNSRDCAKDHSSKKDYISNCQNEVKKVRKSLIEKQNLLEEMETENDDTQYFIDQLKKKALENSIKTRNYLDSLTLEYCPVCLSKLNDSNEIGACKLCHSPIEDERGLTQAKRMMLEINFQIKESRQILKKNKETFYEERSQASALKSKCEDLEQQLETCLNNVQSEKNSEISNLYYQKGLLQGEILQYKTMLESACQYERLLQEKTNSENTISILNGNINRKKIARDKINLTVKEKLKENGVWILQHDLVREKVFFAADDFKIDFADNVVYVSKEKSRYSASSNFYLKLAARFSIFLASLDEKEMRFPRFIFSDNMEDKGMEEDRAKNMQRKLVEKLSKYNKDDYQVIFATSMIAEEFDNSDYVVGEKYTAENKSLKNV